MEKKELFSVLEDGWIELSKKREYPVQRDSPVCIFISSYVCEKVPSFVMHTLLIEDTFHTVLFGEIDKIMCLADPTHLAWSNVKSDNNPSVEEATLITPITCESISSILKPQLFNTSYLEAADIFFRNKKFSRFGSV